MADLLKNIPRLIAHRGAPYHAPENTIASLRQAHALGGSWVEFDVMLTKDGQPIIMHDSTLDRTTNGKGKVARQTFAEIAKCDAGEGQHVPLLNRWLHVAAELGMHINIEIKETKARAIAVAEVIQRELQLGWEAQPTPLISSGELACLQAYRQLDKQVPMALIVSRLPFGWQKKLASIDASAVVINYKSLNQKRVQQIHDAGCLVLAYTVNDAATARKLFDIGVDSLFTDNLPALADVLS